MSADGFVFCVKEKDVKDGQMKALYFKGNPILLVRKGDQVYGLFNRCPHMGCSFERGILRDYLVMSVPWMEVRHTKRTIRGKQRNQIINVSMQD